MRTQKQIARWRKRCDSLLVELEVARKNVRQEKHALRAAQKRAAAILEAQQIAQAVAQRVQTQTYKRIAGVVSKCLEAVFDEPYKLNMNFVQRRSRTEVELKFERGGLEVDPLTASGGGVVAVAAFALRLAALMMSKPQLRKLLVLDEAFSHVSSGYRDQVRVMLETLSKEMDVQIVFVTHSSELVCGKVIEI